MALDCFVYITLPNTTEPITAARFELGETRDGRPLGRLIYGRSYLERADAVEIDPVELQLGSRTYETLGLKGIFGALRDAGPDYWGREVIKRHLGIAEPSELDYLLNASDDRAGALGFGLGSAPPAPKRNYNQRIDLQRLQTIADAILNETSIEATAQTIQVDELLNGGSSMGGARPKVVVKDDASLWIAKFNAPRDKWNFARVEHTMLLLARECGLASAESKVVTVGDRDVLMVKRFDREEAGELFLRARMISGLTLLRAEDSHLSRDLWSYLLLAEELRRVSSDPKSDAIELFRRMCFNAVISNTDDHPRNHAMIAPQRAWRLSPAYDLVPNPLVSQEKRDLALICGDQGRVMNVENLLSQAQRFLLKPEEAAAILTDIRQTVTASWYALARREGVNDHDCNRISGAFNYPGLDLTHVSPI